MARIIIPTVIGMVAYVISFFSDKTNCDGQEVGKIQFIMASLKDPVLLLPLLALGWYLNDALTTKNKRSY